MAGLRPFPGRGAQWALLRRPRRSQLLGSPGFSPGSRAPAGQFGRNDSAALVLAAVFPEEGRRAGRGLSAPPEGARRPNRKKPRPFGDATSRGSSPPGSWPHLPSLEDAAVGKRRRQVSWLPDRSTRGGLPGAPGASGRLFRFRPRLQWRVRAGISPASLPPARRAPAPS